MKQWIAALLCALVLVQPVLATGTGNDADTTNGETAGETADNAADTAAAFEMEAREFFQRLIDTIKEEKAHGKQGI